MQKKLGEVSFKEGNCGRQHLVVKTRVQEGYQGVVMVLLPLATRQKRTSGAKMKTEARGEKP